MAINIIKCSKYIQHVVIYGNLHKKKTFHFTMQNFFVCVRGILFFKFSICNILTENSFRIFNFHFSALRNFFASQKQR